MSVGMPPVSPTRHDPRSRFWLPGSRLRLGLSAALTPVVLASLLAATPQPAKAADPTHLTLSQPKAVTTKDVLAKPRPADMSQGADSVTATTLSWPAAGTAEASVPAEIARRAAAAKAPATSTRVGKLPVWVGPADGAGARVAASTAPVGRAKVEVLDRAKVAPGWRNGLVLRVARADGVARGGRMSVGVGYAGFESAFGADWSTRLRLVALPECALTTPDLPQCSGRPLPSHNDPASKRVSAEIDVQPGATGAKALSAGGATLVALTAAPSGSAGDYSATPLQASSSWTAGGSSGDFSWSYPIRVPQATGPAPKVSLAYSSSAVDGRSDASNNQPSWVGEGFEYHPGFIERRYVPCFDDTANGATNNDQIGDQCWGTDNAVLSLNGRSTELVKDGTTGEWRPKSDDASKVEKLTGGSNGDDNGEYWKVTTADGTQYFFGRDDLPGQTSDTASTDTVRVYGNHQDEPCYNASFASAHCNQAWRWNLDYVVDTHGGTMSFWYSQETNKYAANVTDSNEVSYVRASNLTRIDYGTWDRGDTDRSVTPTAQVFFTTSDRCKSDCATHDEAHWPDTPWDQECTGTTCEGKYSPTFWSTRRLTAITTKVAGVAGDVERWSLDHNFPKNGDGSRDGMWLESIRHTGYIGERVDLPEVNFDWVQRPNRVDKTDDGKPPMHWMRLNTIWTETGGRIVVEYSDPECDTDGPMPASPETNTLRCYPVLTENPFTKAIETDYFHKYVVKQVFESDWTGGGTDVITAYEYLDGAAWHHADDDGMTKDKFRTWSDYRGYGRIRVRKGTDGQETLSETRYYRGMHGDKAAPSGGTRTVTLRGVDLNGDGDVVDVADAGQVNDHDALAGQVREQITYNGVDTDIVSRSVNQGWQSPHTAMRDMGTTTTYARYTGVDTSWNAVKLDAGRGWRVVKSSSTFDSYGMETTSTGLGDVAAGGDEKCIRTTYARNTGLNILSTAVRVETFALPCGTAPKTTDDVISDVRTSYDGEAYGVAPTEGDPTRVETLKGWSESGGTDWLTTGTTVYDDHGRVVESTDVRNNKTITTYTPTVGGPVTKVETTNHLSWKSTQEMDPAWGLPKRTVDANGKITDLRYDGLGRLRKVWLPNRSIGLDPANPTSTPSTEYTYTLRHSGGVNAVTTRSLSAEGSYLTSYALYDGLLRPRQTQVSAASGGGTVFSESVYDAAGRVAYANASHRDPNVAPGTTLRSIAAWEANIQTVNHYDRTGRVTASIQTTSGQEKWRTTTAYGGDRVYVTPPEGGTATTSISDARGNTVEVRQHAGRTITGPYDASTYTYNRKNQLTSVKDPAGNQWSYEYDIRGRQRIAVDPDKGSTESKYADNGDLEFTVDGRQQKLVYHYDSLGRKDAVYQGSIATANLRASWTYDPTGAKGMPASSSRWTDNGTTEYKVRVRGYSPLYRSLGEDFVIPATETGLSGTYSFTRSYKADGVSLGSATYPSTGGLGAEQLTFTYDSTTGLAEQVKTNWPNAGQYVTDTSYNAFGQVGLVQYQQTAQNFLERAWNYEDTTGRLANAVTSRQIAPQMVADVNYTYDPAGNILRIADTPAGGTVDVQCFGHDYARRLTQAWTPTSGNCGPAPTVTDLGGPAPYWHSWAFEPVGKSSGNRVTETKHGTANTESTYKYPNLGSAQPHGVQQVITTGNGAGTRNYQYDAAGNMTCRPTATAVNNTCPGGTGSQTLTWDSENKLVGLTDGGKTHSYLYDPEGNRLIARDPTGKTLYLPGMEIRYTSNGGSKAATRYYSHLGQLIGMRMPGTGITWLVTDHQGTQELSIASGNQAITQRRQTPYGGSRSTPPPAWPNQLGFVGGTIDGGADVTGLTNIGARPYDSAIGKFIAVDPIMDMADPEQWNGYAYAGNSPITSSDPTGLIEEDCAIHDCDYRPGDEEGNKDAKKNNSCWPASCGGNGEESSDDPRTWTGKHKDDGRPMPGPGHLTLEQDAQFRYYTHTTNLDIFQREVVEDEVFCYNNSEVCAALAKAKVKQSRKALLDLLGVTDFQECTKGKATGCIWTAVGLIPAGKLVGPVGKSLLRKGIKTACSFSGDTEVLMADGSTTPMSQINAGDEVLATDPATGESGRRKVTKLWVHEDQLYVLETESGEVATTEDHPFWNESDLAWQGAETLDPGDLLRTPTGVTAVISFDIEAATVAAAYNLTVDDLHTYYVMVGNTPVLVHNANDCSISGSAGGQKLADQLRAASAKSMFTPGGGLTRQAIDESQLIIRGSDLGNQQLRAHLTRDGSDIADWGKYTTRTHQSSYGDFQVHYYYNSRTGNVAYDYDYKVVMNAR
ncbi:intein C-terminal splicing region/intein N-terminal splicing region/RHS repeat-associated core domain-containing protein [Micromonospora coxensis]|uniref:Intein C-terminal splicing region/intein N-terminal splicing region/RHS repeat-associated core domain-containing protein n=2 Tax=Micromonospora coxensis TaxID=356852 RepID=A0A1C5JL12_9ACTN|nr:intein C-terminal splicing region/intein N-terminal splicing region/RHS repeat-associated core domain-containing protein [Micromonospora coxensis]